MSERDIGEIVQEIVSLREGMGAKASKIAEPLSVGMGETSRYSWEWIKSLETGLLFSRLPNTLKQSVKGTNKQVSKFDKHMQRASDYLSLLGAPRRLRREFELYISGRFPEEKSEFKLPEPNTGKYAA